MKDGLRQHDWMCIGVILACAADQVIALTEMRWRTSVLSRSTVRAHALCYALIHAALKRIHQW